MTDKMSEIFDIIGVKPFEKFTIKNVDGVYYFNENLFCFKVGGNSFLLTQDLEWIIGNIEPLPKSYLLSEEERKILLALDILDFKWVSRDENKNIYAFDCNNIKNIVKNGHYWGFKIIDRKNRALLLPSDELFPFIRFEDNKPYEVKEMLEWQ